MKTLTFKKSQKKIWKGPRARRGPRGSGWGRVAPHYIIIIVLFSLLFFKFYYRVSAYTAFVFVAM